MASTVSFDESGNIGSLDRYFVISAMIYKRTSDIYKAFVTLDELKRKRKTKKKQSVPEIKFSNSYSDERMAILKSLSHCSISIVYVAIDKEKSKIYRDVRNCNLYKAAVKEILSIVGQILPAYGVNLIFDENLCISSKELSEIVADTITDKKINSVKKVNSCFDKAIQLTDFISGSIREKYEHQNEEYVIQIMQKISIAHET